MNLRVLKATQSRVAGINTLHVGRIRFVMSCKIASFKPLPSFVYEFIYALLSV